MGQAAVAVDSVDDGRLWTWCRDGGVSNNQLWPGVCPMTGRGLHATSGAGELLLRVPARLLYNTRTIHADPLLGPLLSEAAAATGGVLLSPLATLCFGLMHERARAAASRWEPFLASFPAEMVAAVQLTPIELATVPWALELHAEAAEQHARLVKVCSIVAELLRWADSDDAQRSPGVAAWHAITGPQRDRDFGRERVLWAWSVISTRACYMRCSPPLFAGSTSSFEQQRPSAVPMVQDSALEADVSTLVPWLDLLNHVSSRHSATASFVADKSHSTNRAEDLATTGSYEVHSVLPIASGSPVFLSYGEGMANELLLARYGFVDPNHPSDVAPVPQLELLLQLAAERRCCPVSDGSAVSTSTGGELSRGALHCRGEQFCWQCKECLLRSTCLSEVGLYPLEASGTLAFLTPPAAATPTTTGGDSEDSDDRCRSDDMSTIVSWNMLTIARVLTARGSPLSLELLRQPTLADTAISAACERQALLLLRELAMRLITQVSLAEPTCMGGAEGAATEAQLAAKQRQVLLRMLAEGRVATLSKAQVAIENQIAAITQ